jgi:sec-independent protein translocase protein TatC
MATRAKTPQAEMPFLDHLEELRIRLMWALGALFVGVIVAFVLLVQVDVIHLLERPILPYLGGQQLVFTHPGDPFRIVMSASFILGTIFALPVILYHVWSFLSPALYAHEKRLMVPVLVGAILLFLCGVALSFWLVLPLTLRFLLTFQAGSMTPMITAGDYFGFAISMSLAFGLVFELPILILALTALGIVNARLLGVFRRYAVVLCVVVGAFITPGQDPYSLAAVAVPLYLLYEVSVFLSAFVERAKRRRDERATREAGATA